MIFSMKLYSSPTLPEGGPLFIQRIAIKDWYLSTLVSRSESNHALCLSKPAESR